MTIAMSSMSMPRARMSVATKHVNLSALELEHHVVALGLIEVGVHLTTVDLQTGAVPG
jgi:hypothetical protein